MIVIAGRATVTIADWEEAIQQVQRMVAATEAEPGCVSYRIYVHPTDRSAFFIFEEWESEAALHHHFRTEHMQVFNHYLTRIDAKTDIKRYELWAVLSGVAVGLLNLPPGEAIRNADG